MRRIFLFIGLLFPFFFVGCEEEENDEVKKPQKIEKGWKKYYDYYLNLHIKNNSNKKPTLIFVSLCGEVLNEIDLSKCEVQSENYYYIHYNNVSEDIFPSDYDWLSDECNGAGIFRLKVINGGSTETYDISSYYTERELSIIID